MELLDTTLREGEQCYGVFFPIETKKKLACLLDTIGVDFIEVGHPAAAPSIEHAVTEIAGLGLRASLIAHARMDQKEIRLVKDLGIGWVGLFACINEAGLRRYSLTRKALYARILRALRYAKDIGLNVRFTCEDASRTDRSELHDFYQILRDLGADRLSYADTVGVDSPETIARLPYELGGHVLFKELHFHFHDDLGRARENAETAAMLGARCLDVSVRGIGERSGIPSLREALERTGPRDVHKATPDAWSLLDDAELLVSRCMNYERYVRRRFAHKSGIHIHGVLQDPAQYEAAAPADEVRMIVLSKLVGRAGLRHILSRFGIKDDDATLLRILDRIKCEEFLELTSAQEISAYLEQFQEAGLADILRD